MSHIWGHVEDPPESGGKLTPVIQEKDGTTTQPKNFQFQFVPPDWKVESGDRVGFHLLTLHTSMGDRLIVYDLVDWIDHKNTEEFIMGSSGSTLEAYCYENQAPEKINKFMEMCLKKFEDNAASATLLKFDQANRSKGKGAVLYSKNSPTSVPLKERCKAVFNKTVAYTQTSDFKKFYVDTDGTIKDPNQVIKDVWRSFSSWPIR